MKNRRLLFNIGIYILDAAAIFVSYLLAVVIRYYIMDSDPGINALSAPYLLIAAAYSLIMANVFQISQGTDKYLYRNDYNGYIKILSIHAIGCLVLLSFFYIANVIYFSRWALILFWVISSLFSILKSELLRAFIRGRRIAGRNKAHVLVLGDSPAARDFIKTIYKYPGYGFEIFGFLSADPTLAYANAYAGSSAAGPAPDSAAGPVPDAASGSMPDSAAVSPDAASAPALADPITLRLWDPDKMEENMINVPCRGTFGDLGEVLRHNDINEVVFALSDADYARADAGEMLLEVRSAGANASLVTAAGSIIPNNPSVQEIGGIRSLELGTGLENIRSTFRLGLTLSFSILILFVLMKNFNVGFSTGAAGIVKFGPYKSVLFAISAFFLFLLIASGVRLRSTGENIKSAVITWIISAAAIVIYENIYYFGASPLDGIKTDLIMTSILILCCFVVNQVIYSILNDSTPFMF